MKKSSIHLAALLALSSSIPLHAQSTWNGSTSQDWGTSANWTPSAAIPTAGAALTFATATNYTVDLGNATRSTGALTFNSASAYTFNGGGTFGLLSLTAGSGITQNSTGEITFNSKFTFAGSSERTIGGNGTGTITFNSTVTRTSGAINFVGANEIIFAGSDNNTFGSAAIAVGGASSGNLTTLTLAKTTTASQNAATGTGTLTLSNGILKITNSDAVLANTIQIGSGNGTIQSSQKITINGRLLVNGSRTLTLDNTQKITLNGDTTSSGSTVNSTRTLTLAGAGDLDVNGAMYDSASDKPLAISKTGSGTIRFSGTNSYTGTTAVSAGTLLVSGTGSNQGSFTVSGGTLGGKGTVGLSTTATVSLTNANAILSPGDGAIGILTINGGGTNATAGLILNAGSLVFDIDGLSSDKIVLTNFLSGGAGSSTAAVGGLDITLNGSANYTGAVYELIEFAALPGISLDRFKLSSASLSNGWDGTFGYQGNTLVFTAVPEAGTSVLFGSAVGLALIFGTRRKARK